MGPVAILGQYCNIRGFQLASTAQLVPVSYSGLVFAALLGLVVFDEWPRPATIAGAALIVAGAIWLARRAPLAPTAATQPVDRSEEHTSELQSLMRISYAVFCLKKKKTD